MIDLLSVTHLLDRLRDYSLSEFQLNGREVRLIFCAGDYATGIEIILSGITHLRFSRDPRDEDHLCAFVGSVTLEELPDGGEKRLKEFAFPFLDSNGRVTSFGGGIRYYFKLDGEVFLEIIAGSIACGEVAL